MEELHSGALQPPTLHIWLLEHTKPAQDYPDCSVPFTGQAVWEEPVLQECQIEPLSERLTQLSMCNIEIPNTAEFINTVSHLVNLQYLLFHQLDCEGLGMLKLVPCDVFHNLLWKLKLKHLLAATT